MMHGVIMMPVMMSIMMPVNLMVLLVNSMMTSMIQNAMANVVGGRGYGHMMPAFGRGRGQVDRMMGLWMTGRVGDVASMINVEVASERGEERQF